MTIHYRQQGSAIILFGQTYPWREKIKALGGRFSSSEKTWRLPLSPATLTQVADLCATTGGGALAPAAVTSPASLTSAVAAPASLAEGHAPLTVAQAPLAAAQAPLTAAPALGALAQAVAAAWDVPQARPERAPEAVPAGLTIRQLMDRLTAAVSSAFPVPVWVTAEVQNLGVKASGLFFDLAEQRTGGHANATVTVRAIIWSGALATIQARRGKELLADVLQDGMQIRCLCQVQLYRDRGSVTLVIEDVDPAFTKGALALARDQLLKELRAKGLDQAQKRLPMPRFPLRVGLISAAGSRAKSDFLDQLFSLGFPGEVLFCQAAMQGEGVAPQVVKALAALAAARCDVIVVTRGGGSAADLRWFDGAEVAYAIAACSVPIIAAIGHHDDVSVAEEICHVRQKTPTAAADFVAGVFTRTAEHLETLAAVLATELSRRVDGLARLTAMLAERLAAAAAESLAARLAQLTAKGHALQRTAQERLHRLAAQGTQLYANLGLLAERTLTARGAALLGLEAALAKRDPSPWLAQGWTQLQAEDMGQNGGSSVKSIDGITSGARLRARLLDGWLAMTVTGVEPATTKTTKESDP